MTSSVTLDDAHNVPHEQPDSSHDRRDLPRLERRRSGGERHELLDGHVVAIGLERTIHTRTKYAVNRCRERAIAERQLPCEALVDGMAVRVDERTAFEPDVLVHCGQPLPDHAVVVANPVIVTEVVSISTQRVDALTKLTRYFRNPAIRHYLIVMPDHRSVVHHKRGADEQIETAIYSAGQLNLDLPGVSFEIEIIFPGKVAPSGA